MDKNNVNKSIVKLGMKIISVRIRKQLSKLDRRLDRERQECEEVKTWGGVWIRGLWEGRERVRKFSRRRDKRTGERAGQRRHCQASGW